MATISRYQTASGATLYRVRYRTPGRGQTDKRGFRRNVRPSVRRTDRSRQAPRPVRGTVGWSGQVR